MGWLSGSLFDSCYWGAWFDPHARHWLPWLRLFMVFLLSAKCQDGTFIWPQLFLRNPFIFITQEWSHHWVLMRFRYHERYKGNCRKICAVNTFSLFFMMNKFSLSFYSPVSHLQYFISLSCIMCNHVTKLTKLSVFMCNHVTNLTKLSVYSYWFSLLL